MSWAVVQFLETEEVEVLPVNWITDGLAKYPPYPKANLEKSIKNFETPKSDWKSYKVKLMTEKTFNNFSLASRKASLACLTSDLESEHELPTKRIPIRKKIPSSSSSSSEDGPELAFPTPPKKTVGNNINSSDSKRFSIFEQKTNVPPVVHKTLESGSTDKDDLFKKQVISILIKIKKSVENVESALIDLEKKMETMEIQLKQGNTDSNLVENHSTFDLYKTLPIKEEDQMDECENHLKDAEVYKLFVENLKKIGGTNLTDTTNRLLRRMLTDTIMKNYSRSGHKGKKSFEKTKLFEALTETLQVGINPPTLKEIEAKISTFLSKSAERLKKKNIQEEPIPCID